MVYNMPRELIYFFSKSKGFLEKRLSNFYPSPVYYNGFMYPSIENAFQAAKYECSSKPGIAEELAERRVTPAMAKSLGSKSGMKKRGAVLDVNKWNAKSVRMMKQLVNSRMKTDGLYREIILKARKDKVPFFHFERSGRKSFWGGNFPQGTSQIPSNFVGENMLGKILDGSV